MKNGQLVRKIYVKSLDDLPKDNKKYDVLWKGNDFHRMHGRTMQRYFNDIDWYLQPVEEQKSKLTESQFHIIWTESVGREGYNKKLFQEVLKSLKDKGFINNL